MVCYRAFLFGGVSDNETKRGEDLSSEFHNDLYTFNFTNRRWFAAQLRPPKDYKQQQDRAADSAAADGGTAPAASNSSSSSTAAASSSSSSSKPAAEVDPELQKLLSSGQDKNSAIYKAAVRIQSRFRGYVVRKAYKLYQLGGVVSEILYSPAVYGLDMSAKNMPKPKGRISPQVRLVQ